MKTYCANKPQILSHMNILIMMEFVLQSALCKRVTYKLH
jgi:hypothetical protein